MQVWCVLQLSSFEFYPSAVPEPCTSDTPDSHTRTTPGLQMPHKPMNAKENLYFTLVSGACELLTEWKIHAYPTLCPHTWVFQESRFLYFLGRKIKKYNQQTKVRSKITVIKKQVLIKMMCEQVATVTDVRRSRISVMLINHSTQILLWLHLHLWTHIVRRIFHVYLYIVLSLFSTLNVTLTLLSALLL